MKKKELIKLLSVVAVVCGVVAFATMFLDAIYVTKDYAFSGSEVAFGYSSKVGPLTIKVLKFNFLVTLGYVLPLVGGVLAVLSLNGKGKLLSFISAILLVVGGVLMFLMPSLFSMGIADETFKAIFEAAKASVDVKAFVYVGGVLAIIGGLASLYKTTLVK